MQTLNFTQIASLFTGRYGNLIIPRDLVGDSSVLIDEGFLCDTAHAEYVYCPCGEGHFSKVYRDCVNGEVIFSVYCAKSGGLFRISYNECQQWEISIERIIKVLQDNFHCTDKPVETVPNLWNLGKSKKAIAEFRRQIFFAKRMTKEIEAALPNGTTPLLVIGERCPIPIVKLQDRIFQMHELLYIEDGKVNFDMSLVEDRLNGRIVSKKTKAIPKKGKQALREDNIKELLNAHLRSANDAYRNSVDRGNKTILLPRPTAQNLADLLKATYGEKVDQSTVTRTIKGSKDKELHNIWDGCLDESFIKRFKWKSASFDDTKKESFFDSTVNKLI